MLTLTAIAAAWTVFELIWVVTGEPAPRVDYARTLGEEAAKYQVEGENGWDRFVRAGQIAEEVLREVRERAAETEELSRPDFSLVLDGALDPGSIEWELTTLDLMRERGAFAELAEAAKCRRVLRPMAHDGLLLEMLLPNLGSFRMLARSRMAGMRLAAAEGNGAGALAALEETLALARATGSQPFLIDRLVGYAIIGGALSELRHELLEDQHDAETCRSMLAAMDRQLQLPPVALSLQAERFAVLDLIQRCFTDDGHGDGRLSIDQDTMGSWAMVAGGGPAVGLAGFHAGRAETTRLVGEFYDGMVLDSRIRPAERATKGFDLQAFDARLSYRHQFLRMLLPNLSRVLPQHDDAMVLIAGTRIMLALAAYRSTHGAYPESLDELVPEILTEVPSDPTHGGPFVYRKRGEAAGELPYVLYSTGLDGLDDTAGADLSELDDVTSFSDRAADEGFDLLISSPRPQPLTIPN